MKHSSISYITIISLILFSQVTKSQNYNGVTEIKLASGSTIFPTSLSLKESPYEEVYLLVDNKEKYYVESIDSYKHKSDFYTWFTINDTEGGFRLKRTEQGNINTYSMVSQYYHKGQYVGEYIAPEAGYFQKGNEPIKEINYQNLITSLGDNPNSLAKLRSAKKSSTISKIGFAIGWTLTAGGIVDTISRASSGGKSTVSPYLIAGLGLTAVSVTIRIPYNKKLKDSIKIYNQDFIPEQDLLVLND